MGRHEIPLVRDGSPAAELAFHLRALRNGSALTYQQLAGITRFSTSTLQDALAGQRMATLPVTLAIARACGSEDQDWEGYWRRLRLAAPGAASAVVPPLPVNTTAGVAAESSGSDEGTGSGSSAEAGAGGESPGGAAVEILLTMWREQRAQARQSENHRALLTAIITVLSVIAFIVIGQHWPERALIAVSGPTALLGVFGTVAALKYYERHQMHMSEAQALRRRLDDLFPHLGVEHDWRTSRGSHQERYSVLYHVRLHILWACIPALIAVLASVVTIVLIL